MKKIARIILKHPKLLISTLLVLTALLGFQLKDAKINDDILSYLPAGDEGVRFFKETGKKYGGTEMVIIALKCDDVFTHDNLSNIRKITDELKGHNSITHVSSLTDIIDIRSTEFGLEVADLIDDIPTDSVELSSLRKKVMSKDLYLNNLISANGEYTSVMCKIKQGVDYNAVSQDIKKIASNYNNEFKNIYIFGQPVMEDDITHWIQKDMLRLIPFVFLLVILALFYSFRSAYGVIYTLVPVGLTVVCTMGLMPLFNIELNMISEIIPIILISISSAYGIHVINKFEEEYRLCLDQKNALSNTIDHISKPVFMAALTTVVGFLSLLSSNLTPIREFGLFTAAGVFIALFNSLIFIPAGISLMKPKVRTDSHSEGSTHIIDKLLLKLSMFVCRKKKSILVVFITLSILWAFAIPGLKTESDMSNYFKKNSSTRISERVIAENFGGARPIQVVVNADLKDPLVIKQMQRIHNKIDSLNGINDPTSIVDLICEMNDAMNHRHRIPDTKDKIANLWFFIEGNKILEQMILNDRTEGIIQAKVPNLNYSLISKPLKELKNFVEDSIPKRYMEINSEEQIDKRLVSYVQNENIASIITNLNSFFKSKNIPMAFDTIENIATRYSIPVKEMSSVEKESFIEQLASYLKSEECELLLDSRIIGDIINEISANEPLIYPISDITSVLQTNIPRKMYKDDPGVIGDLSNSLQKVNIEFVNSLNVKRMTNAFLSKIPDQNQNRQYKDDLTSIIEMINLKVHLITPEKYEEITSKKPSDEKIKSINVKLTGFPYIFEIIDRQLVRSQLMSLGISILCVLILISIQFRSLVAGFVSCVPIIFTIITNFGIMRLSGIPLDIATTMIGGIAIGIGIDYTIHFKSRYMHEVLKDENIQNVLKATFSSTGRAIIFNALSVSIGFIVLLLCNLVPLQRFGILTALTMATSAFSALVILPVLIMYTNHVIKNSNNGR